jgi:hypothetical protein
MVVLPSCSTTEAMMAGEGGGKPNRDSEPQ